VSARVVPRYYIDKPARPIDREVRHLLTGARASIRPYRNQPENHKEATSKSSNRAPQQSVHYVFKNISPELTRRPDHQAARRSRQGANEELLVHGGGLIRRNAGWIIRAGLAAQSVVMEAGGKTVEVAHQQDRITACGQRQGGAIDALLAQPDLIEASMKAASLRE
jgi:hypothetical protein